MPASNHRGDPERGRQQCPDADMSKLEQEALLAAARCPIADRGEQERDDRRRRGAQGEPDSTSTGRGVSFHAGSVTGAVTLASHRAYGRGVRVLTLLALVGVAVAVAIWGIQRLSGGTPRALPTRSASTRIPSAAEVPAQRAILVYGSEAGPGTLALSTSQLVFTADSGRVVVVERIDITGATQSRALPDRTVAQPVLVISTRTDMWYFAIPDPAQWLTALT